MPVVLNYARYPLQVDGVTIPPGQGREVPGWEAACASGAVKAWHRAGLLVVADQSEREAVEEPADESVQPEHEPQEEQPEPAANSWLSWR